MQSTRSLSHTHASCSTLLHSSNMLVVCMPAPRRAQRAPMRLSVRPTAVASFTAPNSNAVGAPLQETSPIIDIASPEAFETLAKANPDKLIVLMCKAAGCRPCKAFRPKFNKLAVHYGDAIFCEIMGDRSEGTRNMMRSLKIRATPTFVFFRGGEQIHMHSGINGQKMVDALKVAVKPEETGFCEEVKFAASILAAEDSH